MSRLRKAALGCAAAVALLIAAAAVVFFAFPEVLVERHVASLREAGGLTVKRVRVGEHDIAYLDRGSGIPVLLVHGFTGSKDNWVQLAAVIPDQYRLIALDLPGWGESSFLQGETYAGREQAARLRDFTRAIAVEKFHLVGNSMGGFIAGIYAAEYPEHILSLALLAPAGVASPVKSEALLQFERGGKPFRVESVHDLQQMLERLYVEPPQIPGPILRHLAELMREQSQHDERIQAQLEHEGAWTKGYADWSRIRARTLLLWGDSDRFVHPSGGPVLDATIEQSQLVTLKRCGHASMIECPNQMVSRLVSLWSSVE